MSLRSPGKAVSFPLPAAGPCWECGAAAPVTLYRQEGCTGAIYLCDPCHKFLAECYAGRLYQFIPVFKGRGGKP